MSVEHTSNYSDATVWSEHGKGPDMWVQEEIFGHRFIEEQKPYMLVLEVLVVCDSVRTQSGEILFDPNNDQTVSVAKRGTLRYLLFEDSSLDQLKHNHSLTGDKKLSEFVKELNEGYRGRTSRIGAFNYLKDKFAGKFNALVQAIEVLRSLEIDSMTSRRWTSRFLAPCGPKLLFSDLDNKLSVDRRFFGRGGELMYLMLSRSNQPSEVARLIEKTFFSENDPMNRLLELVESNENERTGDVRIGYLPDRSLSNSYDRLAEDWVAVLGLPKLPSSHMFEPLSRLSALNLVRYFLECASHVGDLLDHDQQPIVEPIVLDVSGGELRDMCHRSIINLRRVRETIEESVATYIRYKLETQVPKWKNALNHSDEEAQFDLSIEAIEETFLTKVLSKENLTKRTPEDCLNFFIRKATSRARNNISTLIEPLGKNSGFITARRGVGTWFDASDEFLEALVLGNSGANAITVDDFLEKIYNRYGIVIGSKEASNAFKKRTFDPLSFENNMKIFERRMTNLGYIRRLSDDCAFILNPYAN